MRLVIGLGLTGGATHAEVGAALACAVQTAGCTWRDVVEIATVESRRGHPALAQLDVPLRFYAASLLAGVRVPHPSPTVQHATGTASVAEAAALAASGADHLLVPKRCTAHVCTAVASVSPTVDTQMGR